MENNDDTNVIVELNNVTEDTLYDEDVINETEEIKDIEVKPKKKKEKKPSLWSRLSKKNKIIIATCTVIVLLVIILLLVYFLVIKKDKKVDNPKEEEKIVIAKDNYIYENGTLKFLDSNDVEIGKYECIDKDSNKCYVAKYSNEDTFDIPKYLDEDENEIDRNSEIFDNKYVFVYDEKEVKLYDIKDEKVLDTYSLVKKGNIDKNIVVLKDKKDKYGIMSFVSDKKTLVDFTYSFLGIISSDSKFVVKDGEFSYLIDAEGKTLSTKVKGEIKSFDDNYIAIYSDNNYALYDYKGKKVINENFDFIEFNSSYIFTVKSTRMFVYDKDLFKLNEQGVKIKSGDYVKSYIFDENNNLKETKSAYTLSVKNNTISITTKDGDNETVKDININEAKVSKNLDYISYLDGTLYFYSDTDKKSLIGSYTCNNKNNITSSDSTFDRCFVAKNSNIVNNSGNLGYIPIINNDYVFIYDTKEGSTSSTVYLYNIKKDEKLATYQAVDTGINGEKPSHYSGTNMPIYARNSEGNLGAITFGNNGPTGLIAFKDENGGTSRISTKGEYYLVKRGSVNYLYSKFGGDAIAQSEFEIIDYANDFLLVKDKGYLLYSVTDGKIISEELDFIKLYGSFYVGIKDHKLNIYLYTNGSAKMLNNSLDVYFDDYSKTFSLNTSASTYEIVINKLDGSNEKHTYTSNWEEVKDNASETEE